MAKDRIVKPFLYVSKDQYRIDNIEDMKGVNFALGDVVDLLGYYEAGDGAHHKRKIEANDDGSGVQLANGLWANIVHNGEVNVSWFGAKAEYIDSSLINGIIKNQNIRKIYFEKNTYHISGAVSISRGDLSIDFGDSSVFIKDCPHNFIQRGDGESVEIENLIIKNLKIYSDGLVGHNIRLERYKNLRFENIEIFNSSLSWNFRVSGNDVVFDKIKIRDATKKTGMDGIHIVGGKNIAITDCDILCGDDCVSLTDEFYGADIYGGIEDVRVHNCVFESVNASAIKIDLLKNVGSFSISNVTVSSVTLNSSRNECISIWRKYNNLEANISYVNFYDIKIFQNTPLGLGVIGFKNIDKECIFENIVFKGTVSEEFTTLNNLIKIQGYAKSQVFKNSIFDGFENLVHGGQLEESKFENVVLSNGRQAPLYRNRFFKCSFKNVDIKYNIYRDNELLGNDNCVFDNCNFGKSFLDNGNGSSMLVSCFKYLNDFDKTELLKIETAKNLTFTKTINLTLPNQSDPALYTKDEVLSLKDGLYYVHGTGGLKKLGVDVTHGILEIISGSDSKLMLIYPNNSYTTSANVHCFYFMHLNKGVNMYYWTKINGEVKSVSPVNFIFNAKDLDSPYHATKMQQEGIYADFITYMDEQCEYERQHRELEEQRQLAFESREDKEQSYEDWLSTQPQLMPFAEPQPSQALLDFKKKYLG